MTDETTHCHDHSILNVIASNHGESLLTDALTLTECNHQTVSQACIQVVTHNDIAFVTDSAAHCKKFYQMCVYSHHAFCFAQILHLVGKVFSHWSTFNNVSQLTTSIKSFFKPNQKQQYLKYLNTASLP